MEGRLIVVFLILVLVSSCNIQKEVPKEEITGKTVVEPKEEVKVVKNETISIENNTKIEDDGTLKLEEYEARSNILSTENKIGEINELLEDLEDKDVISKEEKIKALKKLQEVKDNFNMTYVLYNESKYLYAKELAIKIKKDAKEIVRTL